MYWTICKHFHATHCFIGKIGTNSKKSDKAGCLDRAYYVLQPYNYRGATTSPFITQPDLGAPRVTEFGRPAVFFPNN